MGCTKCGKLTSCGCSSASPYYTEASVCKEDNCQKVYCNQFTFGVCPTSSWNIPACGQTSLLVVPGVAGVSIGSYLWHTGYGYFRVVSVDVTQGYIGIVNECLEGNADPGVQIPANTCFVVTDTPDLVNSQNSNIIPYVAIDFTAPADGDCIDITVTTINGLTAGDTITIGSGIYSIDSFPGVDLVTICNDGEGIVAGTSVIAKDSTGAYQYPINVISSCCTAIAADIAENVSGVIDASDSQSITPLPVATELGVAASVITLNNTSVSKTYSVFVTFNLITDMVTSGATNAIWSLQYQLNGGGWVDLTPVPSYASDYVAGEFIDNFSFSRVFTIAPGASFVLESQGSIIVSGNPLTSVNLFLQVKGIYVRVN